MSERMSEDMSESKDMSEEMSIDMPENMSENMSEDMSEDMSKREVKNISEEMSIEMSENMSKQKICPKKCHKKTSLLNGLSNLSSQVPRRLETPGRLKLLRIKHNESQFESVWPDRSQWSLLDPEPGEGTRRRGQFWWNLETEGLYISSELSSPSRPCQILAQRMSEFVTNM